MDELVVAQHKYISAKRAAELTGYARDYIGQLVRKGKLRAERVGRAWFVHEGDLKSLAGASQTVTDAPALVRIQGALGSKGQIPLTPSTIEISLPKTWSAIKYLDDPVADDKKISDSRDSLNSKAETEIAALNIEPKMQVARPQGQQAPRSEMDGIRVLSRTPLHQVARPSGHTGSMGLFLFLFMLGVSVMLVLGIISST